MSAKTVMAAAAILLGSTVLAPAQVIMVFPQYSYWYGSGYYSPLTGTGVGIPPADNVAPRRHPHGDHSSDAGGRDRNWRKSQNR